MLRLLTFLLALLAAWPAAAETRTFPYEAVVSAAEMYVRSGPGQKYYPTSKLRRGDRVLVHRHDPGGWFMIAPPPGSFSWIPAKYVEKIDATRGTVAANNVVVRVGSFESDIRDLFQRKLSQGDEVRLLGEKMLAGHSGTELWYRIEPPKSEWRWIMGNYVSTILSKDDPSASRNGSDPFARSANVSQSGDASPVVANADMVSPPRDRQKGRGTEYDPPSTPSPGGDTLVDRPLIRKPAQTKTRRSGKVDQDREDLEALDARLQAILDKEVREWDLDPLVQDYRALQERAQHEIDRTQIDGRLNLIARKQQVRAEQLEIDRIGEETLRRDAELAALQREHEMRLLGVNRREPQFDGAGIVQLSALNQPQAPRYVLLDPRGKVLAYLQPGTGVDLEMWIGRPAGIVGQRSARPDLKADFLLVQSLTAVRLAP